jgi:2-phosphosulfolactate phosphatase
MIGLLTRAAGADAYLERAARCAAADELRSRGPDPAYPGVDPDDLDRCLELDRFDFALVAAPDGVTRRLERRWAERA